MTDVVSSFPLLVFSVEPFGPMLIAQKLGKASIGPVAVPAVAHAPVKLTVPKFDKG